MQFNTPVLDLRIAHGTGNAVGTVYSTTFESVTKPSGDGIYPIQGQNQVVIHPYGVGSDNGTGGVRVSGIKKINNSAGSTSYLIYPLAQFAVTLSTATGVASGVIGTASRWADTVTAEHGPANMPVLSSTANIPGCAVVDLQGFEDVKIEPIKATATSMNVLFAFI